MIAFLFSELFNALKYPRVLGYILAGIVFNIYPFREFLLHPGFNPLLEFLSEIGIVFFLLLAGAEMDVSRLRKLSFTALSVGLLSFAIPFILVYLFMSILGYQTLVSLIMALCLSVTAAAIAVEILMEYGLLKTNEGAIIVGAGMIDDLLGVFALTLLLTLIHAEDYSVVSILACIINMILEYLSFFIIAGLLGFILFPRISKLLIRENTVNEYFTISILFGLVITLMSQVFGLSSMVGAFIAGLIINQTIKKGSEGKEIITSLETLTFGLIIPFFFINIGLKFDVFSLFSDIFLVSALIIIASYGKFLGVYLGGRITGINRDSINTIALGMNDRGGIELIIALIAFSNGLIDHTLLTIIVTVGFVTTFISLYYFKRQIKSNLVKLGYLVDGVLTHGEPHKRLSDIK